MSADRYARNAPIGGFAVVGVSVGRRQANENKAKFHWYSSGIHFVAKEGITARMVQLECLNINLDFAWQAVQQAKPAQPVSLGASLSRVENTHKSTSVCAILGASMYVLC